MAINELSPKQIENAKPQNTDYKLSDGGSLYLLIKKTGGKYWRMNYRFAGKQATLALGVYPDVPLATARKRRDEARQVLADGKDPRELKKLKAMRQLHHHLKLSLASGIADLWAIQSGKRSPVIKF